MNENIYCNICNKTFLTIKSYISHINRSLKHKNGYQENRLICDYCNKQFSNISNATYHKNNCKYKKNIYDQENIEKINYLNNELINKDKINKELLNKIKIFETTTNEVESKVEELEEELSKKNKIIEIQKENLLKKEGAIEVYKTQKPTKIYNINSGNKTYIQNIGENLYPIKDSDIKERVDKLNIYHLMKGPETVIEYVGEDYVYQRVVCTDISRNTTIWKDENKEIIHDKNSKRLSQKFLNVINGRNYDPVLKAFDESIDQTSINDLLNINNANICLHSLKDKKIKTTRLVANSISKQAKSKEQLNLEQNTFQIFHTSLKKYIKDNIKNIVIGGLESCLKILISHFRFDNETELFEKSEQIKENIIFFYSSKESETTYFLNDNQQLVIDKYHEIFMSQIGILLNSIKSCTPFTMSDLEYNNLLENPTLYCELYQDCL